MYLPKEKIDRYNKIIQEKYGRDATEEEIMETDQSIRKLAEIMIDSYLYFKKIGKLEKIMEEIESKKNRNK